MIEQTPLVQALNFAEAAAKHLALLASEARKLTALRDVWAETSGVRIMHSAECWKGILPCVCGRNDFAELLAALMREGP